MKCFKYKNQDENNHSNCVNNVNKKDCVMILFKKKLRLISQCDYFKTVNSFEVLMIYTSWADPSLFNVSSFKDRNTCKENQKHIFYNLLKKFSNEMIIS